MKKRLLLSALLLGILFLVFYGYSEYNRTAVDLTNAKPHHVLNAKNLLADYTEDETLSNTKYLNKILEVSGTIASTENQGDSVFTVYLEGDGLSNIACELSSKQQLEPHNAGDSVWIKGRCTGYLMDVVMVQCVLVKN
jgi:hypothetical protein